MVKPTKAESAGKTKHDHDFDFESSRQFVPFCFVGLFVILVFLFRDFLFTGGAMLHGSDMINAGIQARTMLVEYVKTHGSVPQWDPYLFGGLPYVEAFHGDIFYPLSFLKFFGSVPRMIGFVLFLHVFLAGVAMYFAARQFKLSKVASVISAAAYMFAPVLVSLIAPGHDGKMFVTALYPLLMMFLDRSFTTSGFKSFFNFTLTGGMIGLIILTPHPQMSYFMLWSVSFYAAFKLIMMLKDKKGIPALIRPAALTVYAVVLGLMISAIQFYPGYQYTTNFSPRADTKKGWDWAISWSMHEEEAFSLLVPEFVGASVNTPDTKTYYWGKNAFKDNSESVVVAALFMAMLGLVFSHRREGYFFGGLALFSFLYALAGTTPIFRLFYLLPKVESLRAPSMIMYLFSFSIALLAGMGIQYFMDQRKSGAKVTPPGFYYVLFGFPGLLLVFAFLFSAAGQGMLNLWASLFYESASREFVQQGVSKLDVAYMNLRAIQSGAWLSFLFVGATAVLIWLYIKRMAAAVALIVIAILVAKQGAIFDARFVHEDDPKRYWGPNPVPNYLKQQPGEFRVMNLAPDISPNLLPYFHIPVVMGYHGNQLRWYDELVGGPEKTNQLNPRFLNLVGTKYLTVPAGQQIPEGYFGDSETPIVSTFGSVSIVRNDNALPRVFLVDSTVVHTDRQMINMLILGKDTDPRNASDLREVAHLEEKPALPIQKGKSLFDSAKIVSYDFDSITVEVSCATNKLLVMTDTYYDSWHVTIDGASAPLLRADGAFRGVAVPGGKHTIAMVFRSERYATGKAVTYTSTLYLLGIVGFGIFYMRRKSSTSETSS